MNRLSLHSLPVHEELRQFSPNTPAGRTSNFPLKGPVGPGLAWHSYCAGKRHFLLLICRPLRPQRRSDFHLAAIIDMNVKRQLCIRNSGYSDVAKPIRRIRTHSSGKRVSGFLTEYRDSYSLCCSPLHDPLSECCYKQKESKKLVEMPPDILSLRMNLLRACASVIA